jgi:hypothetical protein
LNADNLLLAQPETTQGTMGSLQSWMMVVAFGLSPILTYFVFAVIGRFFHRKRWPPSRDASVIADQLGSATKDEASDRQHRLTSLVGR